MDLGPVALATAFVFGALSFLSPCVLPLVPGYVGLMSGYSAGELRAGEASRVRIGAATAWFVAGFSVVFVALGAAATGAGALLRRNLPTVTGLAGWVILAFGVLMLVGAISGRLGLAREWRLPLRPSRFGRAAPLVMGLAFGFAWTPCIGPVLAAILTLASSRETVAEGMVLLATFALGLGVPFAATALGLTRALGSLRRLGPYLRALHAFSALLLIAFGVVMVTGRVFVLAGWFQRLFTRFGLEWLATI